MISPVKGALGAEYGEMDARIAEAVHRRFGLPAKLPAQIKRRIKQADHVSAWLEAIQIAGFSETEARGIFKVPKPEDCSGLSIKLRPPAEARAAYIARFNQLISVT